MCHTTTAAQTAAKLLLLTGLMALQGCSSEIDVRQSHVEQGLIYKKDASDPFTGKLTNVNIIQVGKRYAAQYGAWEGGCTVPVQAGLFDGVAECKDAKGKKVGEFTYSKGNLDGALKMWAPDTGNLMMSMTVRGGVSDGTEEYYNAKTGKIIDRINYEAGQHVGEEKHWDISGATLLTDLVWQGGKKTGVYRSQEREEHYKAGSYDGVWKTCRWSDSVPLAKRQAYLEKVRPLEGRYFLPAVADNPADVECTEEIYTDGVKQTAVVADAAPPSTGDACLNAKIAAFHKENGDDAPIMNDVMQEWEAGCKK